VGVEKVTVMFLAIIGEGRKVVAFSQKQTILGILNQGDFFGEGCLAGQPIWGSENLLRN
jgi:hypothetical protein